MAPRTPTRIDGVAVKTKLDGAKFLQSAIQQSSSRHQTRRVAFLWLWIQTRISKKIADVWSRLDVFAARGCFCSHGDVRQTLHASRGEWSNDELHHWPVCRAPRRAVRFADVCDGTACARELVPVRCLNPHLRVGRRLARKKYMDDYLTTVQ